tara:strand:- start:2115 stop:2873 length:759 start_codon:yes stop_codon:yes gene_type:complete
MRFIGITFFLLLSLKPCYANIFNKKNKLQEVEQLIVVTTENWKSTKGKLMCFEKTTNGKWQPFLKNHFEVLLGKNGLAWGIGAHTNGSKELKLEGDGRSPAGIFKIGKVYGESDSLPKGCNYPYHKITENDAWVDDPNNPFYNQHVTSNSFKTKPKWFESQRMRLGDHAYHWLIEIKHNSDPPKPGYGSAIFFHVRRGPERRTTGCTVMTLENLERIIKFLDTRKKPHYILLPLKEYTQKRGFYKLPRLQKS